MPEADHRTADIGGVMSSHLNQLCVVDVRKENDSLFNTSFNMIYRFISYWSIFYPATQIF
ncbi:hypothetical protein [Hafnia alvei]|uniref:hypothetical protein n=1 Tax=Hafnia alvei TaxID=569 RepID=UPI0012D3AC19|nr:hypothetical protein [Hafnia alvei]